MTQQLLHGLAKTASRKKLIEIKQKFDQNNVVIFEEGSDLQTILGSLATPLLFPEQRLIILENPPEDFTFDSSDSFDLSTLVLWFDHEVNVKKYPGFQAHFFPESKEISVFPFLDLLAAKDKRAFLEMEKLQNAGFDFYYFLTMSFYLLRNLLVTPKKAPEFVRAKLQGQRKNFNKEKIIILYKEILEIDFKIKSGLLEPDQANFLLVNKFLED